MALELFSIEEKIEIIEQVIDVARRAARPVGSPAQRRYQVLKAIAADLRGRQQLPRSNALGALWREVEKVKQSKTDLGYDAGRLQQLAHLLVSKWPTVSQALEMFGEESAD